MQARRQMESKLMKNTDSEEDLMVDTFIHSRQNVRYQRQERKETSKILSEENDEMSHASLSTTAEENEFGLSEAFLHKWSIGSADDKSLMSEDQSLQLDVLHLKPPNPYSLVQED